MTGVRRSLVLSFLEKYASLVIQLGSGLVIARQITPEAFGTFAVAYAVVGFVQIVREMGVGSYLIQLEVLEPRHIRAALFTTGVLAWSLGVALWLASPLIGRFYGDEVRHTMLILLLSFAVLPLSSTILPTLQRAMNFAALLRINLAGTMVNAFLGMLLAGQGLGAAGLAWASVGGQIAIGLVGALHLPRRAHFLPSPRGAAAALRFGSPVMASSLLLQCSTNVASLITARFVPLDAMGLFARAQSVTGMFDRLLMSGVAPLLLPILSAERRAGRSGAQALGQAFACLAALTWPFFLFVSLEAGPIIEILFGHQWHAATDLLRLIALGGPFWLVGCLVPVLLTAQGEVGLALRAQAMAQFVAVIGVVLATPNGVAAVAAAAIPISAAHALIWLWALHRFLPEALPSVRKGAASSLVLTLVAITPPALLAAAPMDLGVLPELALAGLAAAAGWGASIVLVDHPLAAEVRQLGARLPTLLWSPLSAAVRLRRLS